MRVEYQKLKFVINVVLCLVFSYSNAQTKVTGFISDDKDPIPYVSVVAKSDSGKIIAYTFTNEIGKYILNIRNEVNNLTFSALGYETKQILINRHEDSDSLELNITLKKKQFVLNEVVVTEKKPFKQKKDTIVFNAKLFSRGNEEVVEDLLKNIPGLDIDQEGTIKVGSQEIEKLLIEGDDFFEKGYKILSKNMPSHPIKEVELLFNYSSNRLLKGIEKTDKVALNLKLEEKSKRIWFGNFKSSIGNDNFYEVKTNLMNFGKRNKYYCLSNINNLGLDVTGDINQMIRPMDHSKAASIGDDQKVDNLIRLFPPTLNFKQSRLNFNNAELVSLNAIFNPTKKLKIKTLGFVNWDEKDFFRNTIDNITVGATSFTNNEIYRIKNDKIVTFWKVDITHNLSQVETLETATKYSSGNYVDNSNLVFNENSSTENLQQKNRLFDQKINFTKKLKNDKVLLITSRYIFEKSPQNYRINRFFYDDLFPELENADNVTQLISNQMQFAGASVHLLKSYNQNNLLELQLGNKLRKDELFTEFSILKDENLLEKPDAYQNQTNFQFSDLFLKGKYRFQISDFALVSELDIHQIYNRLNNGNFSKNQSLFFINPSLGFDWEISNKNKIISSFSFNKTNAKILDVFDEFVITGFRSFSKGTGVINQLKSSSLVLNYQLGNWGKRMFVNTFIVYNHNHDYFSTNSRINKNFIQTEKVLYKDRGFLSLNSKFDYYLKFISSNLKLDLGYTKTKFSNRVNDSRLREIKSIDFHYGFELRSGFSGVFDYHLGLKWKKQEVKTNLSNSFSDKAGFLNLFFVLNNKLDFQLQSDYYDFGNLNNNISYIFLDMDLKYKIKKNKLTIGLKGNNLLNTKKIRDISINDTGTSTTQYTLIPRYVLLNAELRF